MAARSLRQRYRKQEKSIMSIIGSILSAAGFTFLVAAGVTIAADARAEPSHHEVREIEIIVQAGYKPNRIELAEGEHVALRFIRKESSGCSREVVFPALGIRKELPDGTPVVIHLPALKVGEYEFRCGMDMIRGKIVVRSHG
jgi:plastocyanin domain-containing protein